MSRVFKNLHNKPILSSCLLAFFPWVSLVFSFIILGEAPKEPGPAAEPEGSLIGLFILFGILLFKFSLLAAAIKKRYFAWVYHILELNFILFFYGIAVVIAVLTIDLNLTGALKISISLLCLFINIQLRSLWIGRSVRERFDVARITHS